jgi:hypothetical protein
LGGKGGRKHGRGTMFKSKKKTKAKRINYEED